MEHKTRVWSPQDRLIVAADFTPVPPDGRAWAREEVIKLGEELQGMGVYIKLNSVLRASGYALIAHLHHMGLRVFADLKLADIPNTLETDGIFLAEVAPELVTVMCGSGGKSLAALKKSLPKAELLGVTVLTSIEEDESYALHGASIEDSAVTLAGVANKAGLDGLICSPAEAASLRATYGERFTINTPAIRPDWYIKSQNDDQNKDRVMTPAKAIMAGATRIVVGRPIIEAKNRREAVQRTLEEIAQVN